MKLVSGNYFVRFFVCLFMRFYVINAYLCVLGSVEFSLFTEPRMAYGVFGSISDWLTIRSEGRIRWLVDGNLNYWRQLSRWRLWRIAFVTADAATWATIFARWSCLRRRVLTVAFSFVVVVVQVARLAILLFAGALSVRSTANAGLLLGHGRRGLLLLRIKIFIQNVDQFGAILFFDFIQFWDDFSKAILVPRRIFSI